MRMRTRLAIFLGITLAIFSLAHWFLYETLAVFWGIPDPPGDLNLQLALAALPISFIALSLLALRYRHILLRLLYKISAVSLGLYVFSFLAACACWIVFACAILLGLRLDLRRVLIVLFSPAVLVGLYGVVNAAWPRVKRITLQMPDLPESWHGRLAALVSDLHLGHVRSYRFVRRIVAMLARLRPDIVFIPGDVYDGTAADLDRVAEPWAKLSAPLGAYFVAGNHEEFSDRQKYLDALQRTGIRVLNNEMVAIDGLQIVGVHHGDSIKAERYRSILREAALDPARPSILLTHAPHRLQIAEEAGISVQLSGHTHGGQFFPFTWIVSRIYGPFVYGLNRFGKLTTYTSSGAGTWGPPMRVGTNPEIVLIRLEPLSQNSKVGVSA